MKKRKIVSISMIAAIYVGLCLLFQPLSFGIVQFRISEILCLLSIEFPHAIIANTIGCLLSNLILGGLGIVDTIVGSFATFMSCLFAYLLRNKKYRNLPILSFLSIIITNGLIVGIELSFLMNNINMIPISILQITVSEFVVIMIIGIPIYQKLINILKEKQ